MTAKRSSPYVQPPQHIFSVGQRVRFVPAEKTVLRPRQEDEALYATSFEVLRLLPRAESALYYRVRDVLSGQERVVSEREITSAG